MIIGPARTRPSSTRSAREDPRLDIRRQLAIVRRRLPLIILSVLLASAAAYVGSSLQAKQYEAEATLIVGESLSAVNPDYNQLLASQRISKTYATIATTRPLLVNVITKLGLNTTPENLLKKVRATAPLDSTLLTVTATDGDPARAAAIANAIGDELIAASPGLQGPQEDIQQSVRNDLDATQALITSTQAEVERLAALPSRTDAEDANLTLLQGRVISLRQTYATLLSFLSGKRANFLSVVEPAVAPIDQVSPRPILSLVLGAVLGLFVATALSFIAEYLDDTVKTSADVQALLRLPTLGAISRIRKKRGGHEMYRLAALLFPRSATAEAYRTLRTNIEFASIEAPVRTLLVTSAQPGEGKTVSAANLAIAFALGGQRVLLLDADLRDPGIHQMFDIPNSQGLTDLLRNEATDPDQVTVATEVENLRILTAGAPPPNPAELLGSRRMRALLERLQAKCDLIVIDSPPLHVVADAAVLGSFLDATVFVIQAGRTRRGVIRESAEALARADARVLGVVLNQIRENASSDYRPYYDEEPDAGPAATPAGGEALSGGSFVRRP
jgi:succinoglycan biosynthesis transport protein ExoP